MGLTVVAMAPAAMIPKKQRGYWMELGEKMRTTSFLWIPSFCKPWETLETADLRWEKVSVSPESESMRAGLSGKEEKLRKRKEIMDRFGSFGSFRGGRRDR